MFLARSAKEQWAATKELAEHGGSYQQLHVCKGGCRQGVCLLVLFTAAYSCSGFLSCRKIICCCQALASGPYQSFVFACFVVVMRLLGIITRRVCSVC